MEPQQPTVLIRVTGKARDGLLALRKKVNPEWSYSSRQESVGAVVARLVEAEQAHLAQLEAARAKAQKPTRARHGHKRRPRRRSRR